MGELRDTSDRGQLASMLKVGLIGFGGGSALIPLVDDELVGRRRSLDPTTFTRHTVVASITPGALPVKLGGLAGMHVRGPLLALAMAVLVAAPGTVATIGLIAAVAAGGSAAVRYVEIASVGITVFIIALLVHYITKVITAEGTRRSTAVIITLVSFLATGAPVAASVLGHLVGLTWEPDLPVLTAVQLVLAALVLITARALLRRGPTVSELAEEGERAHHSGPVLEPRVVRTALLLGAVGLASAAVLPVLLGGFGLELGGLVLLSTLTSFGGGEAYVGVADGFFVGGGYVTSSVFYSQLVPVANALPGPILIKLAAGVGYAAVAPEQGVAVGVAVAAAVALLAVTSCTAVAVLVMGAYHRAQHSPVVQDIGRYILPVICGLLVTTSLSMLEASAGVAAAAGVAVPPVLWASLLGVVLATWVRHRHLVHDVVLLTVCGAVSLAALTL